MVLWSWYILLPGPKEIDIIKKSPKNLTAAVHYHLLSEINHLMCDTIKLYDALLLYQKAISFTWRLITMTTALDSPSMLHPKFLDEHSKH